MTTERLVSSQFPYLPIHLRVRNLEADPEALVDTGFDGWVVVPPNLMGNLGTAVGEIGWQLADDSEILSPAYRGAVELGPLGTVPVIVAVMGSEVMIGRRLTNHFSLIFDHGQRVILEP